MKLTTDADGNGIVSPGDTLTYTVTYVNTGNAAETGFQITDQLPAGVTITSAGAQTVRVNGTVSAAARNTAYTGTGTATALLAAGQTLAVNGTISVDIPVTVGTVGSASTTVSNQTSTSGSYVNGTGTTVTDTSVPSDNVDNTTAFPPSVAGAAGFPGVPSGSLTQTQGPATDPTTVTVTRQTLNVSKSFSPTTVQAGGVSALTITVTNPYSVATTALALTDNIAATMGLSTPLPLRVTANTCGGSVVTGSGNTALTTGGAATESNDGAIRITGGSIAANASCSLTVNVTVVDAAATTRTNTIPAANVTGTVNGQSVTAAAAATANLTVTASAAGTAYTCDARFYQLRQDPTTLLSNLYQLDRTNLSSGGAAQWPSGFGPGLNALAFNKADGYFYAVNITPFASGAPFRLYRLGRSGAVEVSAANLGIPTGSSIAAATIDANGVMYIKKLTNDAVIYRYTIGTGATSTLTINGGTGLNIFDLAFNPVDGFLYGVVTPGGVYRINVSTGAVTPLGTPAAGAADFSNYIGSAFFDVSGTLYAYQNGGTYGTISTTNGTFTTLATAAPASQSDGASCVFPDNRIDVVKSVGTVTAVSSTTFDVPYTVTVKNTGTVSDPNVQLTENLSATFSAGNPGLSIVTGPTVSGGLTGNSGFNGTTDTRLLNGTGTLAAGASATVTFTVRVAYPDRASVPGSGTQLNNMVYASTTGSTNAGYTFVSGTPIPPVDLLANDMSTNGSTPPATANGDTASATPVTLPDVADLAVDKSGPVAVGSGASFSYTVRVWNNGPSSVTGAAVTDTLPSGFTVTNLTCAATGTASCGTQTFTGSSVTISTGTLTLDTNTANGTPDGNYLTYTVTGTAPVSGSLSNMASVAAPATARDTVTVNNTSATVATRVVDAVNDTGAATFNQAATFTILGNDTVGGAGATTVNVTLPVITDAGGLRGLSVNSSGQLVLTPQVLNPNLPGTYTVTYRICDAAVTGACDTATATITITPASADLGISKAQRAGTSGTFQTSPLSVPQDSAVQYQLTVTNNGPAAVTDATFSDAVPSNLTGLSVISASGTGTTCAATFTGNTLNGTFSGTSGQSCTVVIQGAATTAGTITNTTQVAAPSGITDALTGNNTSSVDATITPAANLSVTKTDGVTSVNAGAPTTYTIRVTNAGPSSVTGATLTDAAVAGLNVTAVNCSGTPGQCTTGTTPTVTELQAGYALPALTSGQFYELRVTGTVTATSGSVTNTAQVAAPSGVTDTDTTNNAASDVNTVTPVADLAVDKSGPVAVGSGASFSYTIRVWNNGPSSVTGAAVTDTLPSGFTFTGANVGCVATGAAICGSQSVSGNTVTFTTGTLPLDTMPGNAVPDGNYLTFTVTGTAPVSGSLSNMASVAALVGTQDTVTGNNTSATVTTRIVDAVNDTAVNLPAGAGGTVSVLGNDTVGGAGATTTNAAVSIQNNGGLTGLTVNASGQLVVPTTAPAGTYTVMYKLCDATVTTACDTATVTVTVAAVATADVTITKTGPAYAKPGGDVTYTLTVSNSGAATAAAVSVTDLLPPNVTYKSSAPTATVSGQNLTWSVGSLASGASQILTVVVTAPSAATLASTPAARTLTNTATVSTTTPESNPDNNSASAVTQMVDAALTKTVKNVTQNTAVGTTGGGKPGEVLEYCIAFENIGAAALPNFVVTDQVPGNTTAQLTGFDAQEPSAATGFGVKLTRGAATSYLTSAADTTDTGSLTDSGGTYTRGTLSVNLGSLAVGEKGSVCFRTTIR